MKRWLSAVVVAVAGATTASACTGSAPGGSAAPAQEVPFVAVDAARGSDTDRAIARAQDRLRADPDDLEAKLALAQAFLQKARETADPTLYGKAGLLLEQVDEAAEPNAAVVVAEGTLALAQHRFADARELGVRARRLAPGNEAALGVLVDANNELGRYDEALEVTQEMVDARPNLASLSRASYARELRGDLSGAVLAMTQAVTAGGSAGGENLAYVQVLLGNLLLTSGDLEQASASYDAAERSFPGFPAARAGRARLLVAQARYGEAGDLLHQVVRAQPLAEYAIAEGDAYRAAGDDRAADDAYGLVGAITDLYRANGVDVDLELALFDADRNPTERSLAAARRALQDRPSILGHDVVAWNLHRLGRDGDAARHVAKALETGSREPLLRFHAAVIAAARGERGQARAHLEVVLGSNPRFSAAHVDEVAALADELGLEMPPPLTCDGCS